jgi:hypothetical protein
MINSPTNDVLNMGDFCPDTTKAQFYKLDNCFEYFTSLDTYKQTFWTHTISNIN